MVMSKRKISIKNIIFLIIIVLLIIPQTRQQIQIVLHKGLAMFSPGLENEDKLKQISDYNWNLNDLDGNLYNLNNSKGKVTLVNIWATWCPPCIAEMPSLQSLSSDYKDKMDIFIVSNEDRKVVNKFMTHNNYNFPAYISNGNTPETFNVRSIPRTFLIDKKGNIIIDETGAANWNSDKVRTTIDKLLKL